MNISTMDLATGNFSGTGFYNADNSYTWQITGNVKDSGFTFHILYTGTNPGYTIDSSGVISDSGSLSGTAKSISGQTFNFNTTSGYAKPVAKEDCKKEGWIKIGSKNQGQCINNFNQENKSPKDK